MKHAIRLFGFLTCFSAAVSLVSLSTGCAGDRYSRSTGEAIDDASITAKVKSELLSDPDVKGMQVKVDTFRGKVQLTGFVDNAQQKSRAEEIAVNTKGVQWVKNDLIVKMDESAGAEIKVEKK